MFFKSFPTMKDVSKFNVKLSYDKKKVEYHKKIEKIDQRRWRCVCVKTFTVLFCIAGFTFNSLVSFKQFFEHETVTTIDIRKEKQLPLPSITLCGNTGFKKEINNHFEHKLEQYLTNTLNFSDLIDCIKENGHLYYLHEPTTKCEWSNIKSFKISTTYSAYRGRCYTIEYQKEVAPHFNILIRIKGNPRVSLLIHNTGEEFFLHYDYWPNIPFTYKSSGDIFWEEFGIQKQLQIKSSEDVCMKQNYDYFDCLRAAFKEEMESKNLSCTLPWIQSMMNEANYSTNVHDSCNTWSSFYEMNTIGKEFARKAARYAHEKCPESCERAIYKVNVQSFDRLDFPFIQKINQTVEERFIIFYYSNEDVKIYTTSELFTFSSFISSIGGNLGLFVGFSFIGVVLFVCNFIEKLSS